MRFIVSAVEKDIHKGKAKAFAAVLRKAVLDCYAVISGKPSGSAAR